ncbi:6-phosphogluconolactonase [bacterium]|nr:6-phosphogluconolactonase [candidate division CSSED10-310 bacterium]
MSVMMRIARNPDELAAGAAEFVVRCAGQAMAEHGCFTIALAGGATPRLAYGLLAREPMAGRMPWEHVHVFWSDERNVPPDHPDSNYLMAHAALLSLVPIPTANIHRMPGEAKPEEAARHYHDEVLTFFFDRKLLTAGDGRRRPRFDLILLGLGSDGHTASLFPGSSAIEERDRLVVAWYVDSLEAWRITFTPWLINGAARICFLVAGERKAAVLKTVLEGPRRPMELPAQAVRPVHGNLFWLLDEAAAALLHNQREKR